MAGQIPNQAATKQDVADIMWFLQVKSQTKVGDFSEGAMTVPDPPDLNNPNHVKFDHPEMRFGEEVIFTPAELR